MSKNKKTTAKTVLEFEKPIADLEAKIQEMRLMQDELGLNLEIDKLERKVESLRKQIYDDLTRWQRVQVARHPERPYTLDYINNVFEDFIELHGDRQGYDDKAIVGGFGKLNGKTVMVVGHQKGRDTKSNLERNFGMPNPEGYRKALRFFQLAEKFNKPVVCLLDTPGAFPGLEAEERGQAEAIARNLLVLARLKVPVVITIIGEGASGGALGIGVGDRFLMLENSWYSVIAPESCSSILWRSWDYKEQAAEALKLTAPDLVEHGIIDVIVPEPTGGAHSDHERMYEILKQTLQDEIEKLQKLSVDDLLEKRLEKLTNIGVWQEVEESVN